MDETMDLPEQPNHGYPRRREAEDGQARHFELDDVDQHVLDLHVRVLYPFTFDVDQIELKELSRELAGASLKETSPRKKDAALRDFPLWSISDDMTKSLYAEEASAPLIQFLFGGPVEGRHSGGKHLRIPDATRDHFFRNKLHLESTQRGKPLTTLSGYQTEIKIEEVELFLSSLGVGVLSFSVIPLAPQNLIGIKSLNYWLSQQGKKKREARLWLPHPSLKLTSGPAGSRSRTATHPEVGGSQDTTIAAAPAETAPFEERFGRAGGWFSLNELKNVLLSAVPRMAGEGHGLQEQFSVFTSVRFGPAIRFSSDECRRGLAPLLAGLAQVEEATHPGVASLEHLGVESAVLNAQHWAAVGSLGAAHLVSDNMEEDASNGFNEQRTGHIQKKYFTSFLLAYFQSIFLGVLEREAAGIMHDTGYPPNEASINIWAKEFPKLRRKLLIFDLLAVLRFASQREVHNRAYHLAQHGLGVQRALGDINRAISQAEEACGFWRQAENISHLVVMQRKVEIVEVFLISIYSIYYFHYAGEPFFEEHYIGASTIVGPVVAACVAYYYLVKKAEDHERVSHSAANSDQSRIPPKRLSLRWIFPSALVCWILGIMLAYLGLGAVFFRLPKLEHSPVVEEQKSEQSHSESASGPHSTVAAPTAVQKLLPPKAATIHGPGTPAITPVPATGKPTED